MQSRHASGVFLVLAFLGSGCSTTPSPRAISAGDWHFSGGSRGLLEVQDGGDFGDETQLAAEASGGRFTSDRVLLEGIASLNMESTEDEGSGADADTTVVSAGAGARYYFDSESLRRPYVAASAALARFDIDIDGFVDDSDIVPLLQARVGMEIFLTEIIAIDLAAGVQHVFELQLENVEDDITTFGISAGISLWP